MPRGVAIVDGIKRAQKQLSAKAAATTLRCIAFWKSCWLPMDGYRTNDLQLGSREKLEGAGVCAARASSFPAVFGHVWPPDARPLQGNVLCALRRWQPRTTADKQRREARGGRRSKARQAARAFSFDEKSQP
jgi:hypothetical protein